MESPLESPPASPQDDQQELMALFAKKPHMIKPGLDRIRKALHILIDRERQDFKKMPPVILVGGTNGKGTTSGYLYQLLVSSGHRVGLFSSPHLIDFAERIQHSHFSITNQSLVTALELLKQRLKVGTTSFYDDLSFFEVNTLLARQVFLDLGCDFWIFEVGMGGRWDATNAFDPCLAIITTIGLDHQEYLGSDTKTIAGEKAGIMRPEIPVIWGGADESDAEAHAEICRQARQQGARLVTAGTDFNLRDHGEKPESLWCRGGGCQPFNQEWALPKILSSAPHFLKQNFMKAWAAYWQLSCLGLIKRPSGAGLEKTLARLDSAPKPPGLWARFQELRGAPQGYPEKPLILDVAHNPHGARALKRALLHSKFPALISILKDKDCDGILDELRVVLDPVVLFGNKSERGFTKQDLAERHQDLAFLDDFTLAWDVLDQKLGAKGDRNQDQKIVVAGSVYALGEVLGCLGVGPLKKIVSRGVTS